MAKRLDADDSRGVLARLLDTPHLARAVPHLAPETLHQIIQHSGLGACGDLVASATVEQLTSVLDLDLWRDMRPGGDPQLDVERFGEWLELLVDTGEAVAARTVAAIDGDLLVAGLSRYVRVFDAAALVPVSTDDDPGDREEMPPEGLSCDVGGYVVRARRADAWDAIVTLLHALDQSHPDRFRVIMQGCQRLSNSTPEVDGLDDLLQAPDQLLHDVSVTRERRRTGQGYTSPADARAFLQSARQRRGRPDGGVSVNHVAAAYVRASREASAAPPEAAPHNSPNGGPPAPDARAREALARVADLLAQAGIAHERPRALMTGTGDEPRLAAMRPLMERLRDTDETTYLARSAELAFLANTLVAGCSVQSRRFTPQEAADAVVSICNLGLEYWPEGRALADAFLTDRDLVDVFEVGWAALHEEVSMFVAGRLIATLGHLRSLDVEVQKGLNVLHRELAVHTQANTPWRARGALDVIAMLDVPAWVSLAGLLDECPVLPASLTATLEGHTGPVSATAFEFISTNSQVALVRTFMARLPDILSR